MNRLFILAATLMVSACPGSAPPLPPAYGAVNSGHTLSDSDFTATERAKSCDEIEAEQRELLTRVRTLRGETAELHDDNQNVGFAASLIFPPAWILATDTSEQVAEIRDLQGRWDHLLALERYKECMPASD
ncbi:MAG: hypothetical protein GY788_28435 [bacterium]|nr:hypothetical protein [bacterium]